MSDESDMSDLSDRSDNQKKQGPASAGPCMCVLCAGISFS